MSWHTQLLEMWIALSGLCVGGCQVERCDLLTVEGWVLSGAQPLAGVHVVWHPQHVGRPCAVGITDGQGHFVLSTRSYGDGALPGMYVITLTWPEPSFGNDPCENPAPHLHDRCRGKYADPRQSTWRVSIQRDRQQVTIHLPPEVAHLAASAPAPSLDPANAQNF